MDSPKKTETVVDKVTLAWTDNQLNCVHMDTDSVKAKAIYENPMIISFRETQCIQNQLRRRYIYTYYLDALFVS